MILITLGTIAAVQTSGTTKIENSVHKLLDYCATHPDATLQYKASGIILKAYIGASYFSWSQDSSKVGGLFYMGDATDNLIQPNGAIMVISTIMRNVMLLAAEEECG